LVGPEIKCSLLLLETTRLQRSNQKQTTRSFGTCSGNQARSQKF